MTTLQSLTPDEVSRNVQSFVGIYIDHWNEWLLVDRAQPTHVAAKLGEILRKWKACRPNRMRRVRADNLHSPPYLEDLIEEAGPPLLVVEQVTLRSANEFTTDVTRSLSQLWSIFENLSYNGKSRRGLTGVVGMSKAVLLLTNGRIGPAFDSEVRRKLTIKAAEDSGRWIAQLESVAADIESFERQNGCRLAEIVPERFRALHNGRLYDMAFGPRG